MNEKGIEDENKYKIMDNGTDDSRIVGKYSLY